MRMLMQGAEVANLALDAKKPRCFIAAASVPVDGALSPFLYSPAQLSESAWPEA